MSTRPENVDAIVHGDYVVTMNDARFVIEDGAVAIDSGVIAGVGSSSDIKSRFSSETLLEGEGRVVMPGLINGHTHAGMSLLRGYADDIPLMPWLQDHINPVEAFAVAPDFVEVGTELCCWEMLSGGTTTFADMYFFHEVAAQVVERVGMRALISANVVDQPRNDAVDIEDSFDQAERFIADWSERETTVVPVLSGHAIYTLKNEHLLRLRDMAKALDVPIHIHISESQLELDFSRETYGVTPIEHFNNIGFLDVPVIAAHVVWPSEDEIEILAQKGVGVVHNPKCNAKIASGTAPIKEMLERGVKVGLGTDGAASSNDVDMWQEMRMACVLQRARTMESTDLPARELLKMATTNGAAVIGMADQIGMLSEGMRADVIHVSIDNVHQLPLYDVESHLAYSTTSRDVQNVFVDGKLVLRDREPTTINISKLRHAVSDWAKRIAQFKTSKES